MVDCIVCKKPLSDILRQINMEFHPGKCAEEIIKLSWHFLDIEKDIAKPPD